MNMQYVRQMIEKHGGLEAVRQNYLRIENPPFMRLAVEVIGPAFPDGTCEISVAHYSEQNGDAMRDPEITFLVTPNAEGEWQWKPLTFRNDYVGVYQVAAEYDNFGSIRVRDAKLVRELSEFASQWDMNLKHQEFIEAFQRKYPRTLNGAEIGATDAVP